MFLKLRKCNWTSGNCTACFYFDIFQVRYLKPWAQTRTSSRLCALARWSSDLPAQGKPRTAKECGSSWPPWDARWWWWTWTQPTRAYRIPARWTSPSWSLWMMWWTAWSSDPTVAFCTACSTWRPIWTGWRLSWSSTVTVTSFLTVLDRWSFTLTKVQSRTSSHSWGSGTSGWDSSISRC